MFVLKFDRLLFDYLTKRAGYTNEDVAEAMGITRQTLTSKMAGRSDFTVAEAISWSNLVGADLRGVFYTEASSHAEE